MKAQYLVTVEGEWKENGKPITAAMAENRLREFAKDGFNFLAKRVTVKRHRQESTKSAQDDGEKHPTQPIAQDATFIYEGRMQLDAGNPVMYACDKAGMLKSSRCGDCLCWS